MNKFFLTLILALAITSGAFGQIQRLGTSRDAIARVEEIRAKMLILRHGNYEGTLGGTPQQAGGKVLVWTDRKFYLPGEEIKIRALGLAADAENLQFSISERFSDSQGNMVASDSYPCDCGGSNGGFVPKLGNFGFLTLVSKRVPNARMGRYDFSVGVYKYPGNGAPAEFYQATSLSVIVMSSAQSENNPIVIESVQQIMGQYPILFLTGKFPVNTPMYYFVGAPPYEGGFSSEPSLISPDGRTLVLGAITGEQMEGRVVLMLPDGSFSTTSAQTFVPTVVPPGQSRQQ